MKGKRIFLTGGAGFIGSWLARRLADDNQIVLYDSLRRNAAAQTNLAAHPNVTLVQGDVLDLEHMAASAAGATHLVHMAAVAGIDTVTKSPTSTMNINLLGTYHACETARRLPGLERLVTFSTSEVYGPECHEPTEEDFTPVGPAREPRWVYAASKVAGEHLAMAYHREFGLPAVCVRPFNVYGPGQVGEGAIQVFIKRALCGEPLRVRRPGDQVRAWTFVDDAVDALMEMLLRPEAVGQIFNMGNAHAVATTLELAELVRELCGSSSTIEQFDGSGADVQYRVPNVDKAQRLLGWTAQVSLRDGIARTAAWFRSQQVSPV